MNKQRSMVPYLLFSALLVPFLFGRASAAQEEASLSVTASSFSDPALTAVPGEPCADFLKLLTKDEGYRLLSTTSLTGPPGVLFTLEGPKKDLALVKCGTSGGGCGGGGGGEDSCEH